MNVRKLLSLSDFLSAGLFIYLLSTTHPQFLRYAIVIIAMQIIFETGYFSYEYFTLYKPKRIFILGTRSNYFNLDSLVLSVLVMTTLYLIAKRAHHYDLSSGEGVILGMLSTSRGLFYAKFRRGARLDEEGILFNDFFFKDLLLREIKSVKLDMEAQDIVLTTLEGKDKKVRLSEEFYEHNKEHLLGALELIKGKLRAGG